ncbi:Ig-like domain-containing protein [Candidatus Parabeggiatoa sp. HSG14]|uniref:Ig-like domain-containing protein n=1 Tax=Candidatus Parabeggiatoa sp. HSG14 TaxID=3055593 RepID=UPI0025A835C0|nr:Ig-like domain-containing protein [Thiotrichales bacterium HSG14]
MLPTLFRSIKHLRRDFISHFLFTFHFSLFTLSLLAAYPFLSSPVYAEGSRELVSIGGYRPYLQVDPTRRYIDSVDIPLQGVMKVYVKKGEQVNLGSSIYDAVDEKDIVYRSPNGSENSCNVLQTGFGYIDTVAKETAGPLPINPKGYMPCTFTADEEGIYEIHFNYSLKSFSVDPDFIRQKTVTANFLKKEQQGNAVAAWDITVLKDVNGQLIEQKGRVYTNYLPTRMGGRRPLMQTKLFVQSNTGYLYRVDINGLHPLNMVIFSNNKGFQDASGLPLFQSIKLSETNKKNRTAFLHNPAIPDTSTDITHKIFFNPPASDLPAEANLPDGQKTWLLSPPVPLPEVTNFKFTGSEGTPNQARIPPIPAPDAVPPIEPTVGIFGFNTTMAGHYLMVIDINGNDIYGDENDRILKGRVGEGDNQIPWDGLDGNNEPLVPQTLPFNVKLNLIDDVHFPFLDPDKSPDGFSITRINCVPDQSPCEENDFVYYDNSRWEPKGQPSDPISALGGIKSGGGIQTFDDKFSADKGIDTWSMLAPPITLEGDIYLKKADLTVSKTHITTPPPVPDGPVTYTITVHNGGPSDVVGIKVQDSLPATITESFWTCAVSESEKSRCALKQGSGAIDTTVDLKNGATATFTIDTTISGASIGETISNSVTITRPNDVTNPQGSTEDVKTETAEDSFTLSPPANKQPVANNKTTTTPNDTAVQLPALEANDEDGTIAFYTAFNLPVANEGSMYIGDPDAAGILLTEGQQITPEQISTLFFKPNPNATEGDVVFNYTATDDKGATSDAATVTITVTVPPTQPPEAENQSAANTPNDTTTQLPALSATDPDGTIASYTITTLPPASEGILYLGDPENGGIPITPGQQLTPAEAANLFFKPNPNFTGDASFTYTATDNQGAESAAATVTIPVTPSNTPPVSNNITAPTTPNNVTEQLPTLEATDDDTVVEYRITTIPPESEGLLYIGDPAKGGRLLTGAETITPEEAANLFFKPNPDFAGDTSFGYTAIDKQGAESNPSTVSISVTQPPNDSPIANNDSSDTNPGVPVTIPVLINDSDPNDNIDPGNVFIDTSPEKGEAITNTDGTVTYTPDADFTEGSDIFTYQVCDTGTPILCSTATVTISVPVSQKLPIANNKTASSTLNDETAQLPPLSATDLDGTIASYVIDTLPPSEQGVLYLGDPAKGGVPITKGQQLTPEQVDNLFFEPNNEFIGDASFTYSAIDNLGGVSSPALVTIPVTAPVNTRPTVNDVSANTEPNTPVTIPILNNDSDPEGNLDRSSLTITTQPPNGNVTINPDGTVTYTPNASFTDGTDLFIYQVCDTGIPQQCDTATVTIGVLAGANQLPVSENKTTPQTPNNTTVPLPSLSATDSDGTVASYTIDTIPSGSQGDLYLGDPAKGGVPITKGQSLTPDEVTNLFFQPNELFTGNATFTYSATDDQGAKGSEALVTIPVIEAPDDNKPPVANDDSGITDPEVPINIAILDNDSDPEGGFDTDTLIITAMPSNGNVIVNTDGTVTYTHNPGFTIGSDTFTYEICDNGSPQECDTAQVTVLVPIIDEPPNAENKTAPATTNDTTEQLPPLSATDNGTVVSYAVATLPSADQGILYLGDPASGGTPVVAGQTLTPEQVDQLFFQPEPNFIGNAGFTYTATDDMGVVSSPALVTIPVTAPANSPPVANKTEANTEANTPATIPILNNDSDPNGDIDAGSVTITEPPENGTASVNPDGTINYTPNEDFSGNDTFTYQVCDSGTPPLCDTANIEVAVLGPTAEVDLILTITGNGSVISNPAGIECNQNNAPCTHTYEGDTKVTLTQTPDTGWVFEGWRGHCDDTGSVTMDANKQCKAVFVEASSLQFDLNVARLGHGSVSGAGIDCGSDCSEALLNGTEIELTATPDPGYTFTEWTGDCSGTSPTITVNIEAAKRCQANFVPDDDNDGVANEIEDAAPNGGDGNNDGILDSQQAHVASLKTPDGNYITVEEQNGCTINDVRLNNQSLPADGDYSMPSLLDWDLACPKADIKTYYHGLDDLGDNPHRQYAPENRDDLGNLLWQDLPVEQGVETIQGKSVPTASFTLTDGGLGDKSPADGKIVHTSGLTINPGHVQFSSPTYTVNEYGNVATIAATRTGGCDNDITVNYATQDGTAIQNNDYVPTSGTLAWANGDCSDKTFTVTITDDSTPEENEDVNLSLSNPTGYTTLATPDKAILTIVDDEISSPTSTSPTSCYNTSTCQVCCPSCSPLLGSDLNVKSLTTTIKVGETLKMTLADGKGELLIKEIPDKTFVSLDDWKSINTGAAEVTLSGVSVGETKMVVSDSAAPLQTLTIYITVIDNAGEGDTFGIKALETTIRVGQNMDLTVAGGQGELSVTEIPNPALVLLETWTPLGDTGAGQFTLKGISIGQTKVVISDRANPPQKTTFNITVVESDATIGITDETNGMDETDKSCKKALVVDAQGNPGTNSQTCFTGNLYVGENWQPNHRRFTHSEAKILKVSAKVLIEPTDVDKVADIVMVGIQTTLGKKTAYYRDEQIWHIWDGQIGNLPSAQHYPKLPGSIEIFIYEDNLGFDPGEFTVYTGYRLTDGTIIYNGAEPIHFWITNSASVAPSGYAQKADINNNLRATSVFEGIVHNTKSKTGDALIFDYDDSLTVSSYVSLDPQHVGQSADILMVAEYAGSVKQHSYTRVGPVWETWDHRIESLLAAQHYHRLPEILEIPVYVGSLIGKPGVFKVYVGYRLEDGVIVFNGIMPIHLTVANGFGLNPEGDRIYTTSQFLSWTHQDRKFGNPYQSPFAETVGFDTTILVDQKHIGEQVDILMVVIRQDWQALNNSQPEVFLWGAWEPQAVVLEASTPDVTLKAIHQNIPPFKDQFKNIPGMYTIYFGYRLKNGNIFYNGGEPLQLKIW